MSDAYELEQKLFAEALARLPAERARFLDAACAGDAALRGSVAALLREHDSASVLDAPSAAALAAREVALPAEKSGDRIGRYVLHEPLGEGGCGVVWRAEQTAPVRREVALKIIKLGMDTREVIARFEAERQALALMEHPHIARVFDAGATDTGRPYFAMELVRGERITDYCDRQRLRPEARLRLFIDVCQAVQHAHQKGVIHRDLKPSNILVAADGVAPAPKVIDFGVAKAMQGRLTERTVFTAVEQFIGTPAYMSPEQAAGAGADVDTRSDIYSLGVLLYELLTGCTPLDAAELRPVAVEEIRRRICEAEPARPSVRVRALDHATCSQAAACRQLDPDKFVHLLRGDLDWVVMRCLEKERARRYETVDGLARDLERHLNHEPVSARPPSVAYTLRKLVRRHRVAFAAGGAVALALLAGLTVSTTLYFRSRVAQQAEAQQRRQAEAEKLRAQAEAVRSAQVARFMEEMLGGLATGAAHDRDTALIKELIGATARRLDGELRDQPDVEADLRFTIGRVYWISGEYPLAEQMLRRCLELRRKIYGGDHEKVAAALWHVAQVLQSTAHWPEAAALLHEELAMLRRLPGGETLQLADCYGALARDESENKRFAEAERLYRETLRLQRKFLPETNSDLLRTRCNLAGAIMNAGRRAEAEPMLRGLLADLRAPNREPAANTVEAMTVGSLAQLHAAQGNMAEAESDYREAKELWRKAYQSDDHPRVLETSRNLARMLMRRQAWADAEVELRDLCERLKRKITAQSANLAAREQLADALVALAETCSRQGHRDDAEFAGRASAAIIEALPPASRARSADLRKQLNDVLARRPLESGTNPPVPRP